MNRVNYFMNYKSLNNKHIELRFYSSKDNKIKRLYVDKAFINEYLYISDNKNNSLMVHIGSKDNGLKVNKQGFISLNKLSDKAWNMLKVKPLVYDVKMSSILNNIA